MDTLHVCPSPAKTPADLARIYLENRSFVRSVLLGRGVPPRDVDDLVHDAFIVVQGRIGDLDPTHTPLPWLYVIAIRVASNYRRRARIWREELPGDLPDEPLPETNASAEDEFNAHEAREQVLCRVSRLRPKLRAVVIAHELEGRPMPEVAASLGIPLKTAYARLRLSREALARSAAALRAG
jgi:RNA polymerase sigma-70 factor (ECF subfamily)